MPTDERAGNLNGVAAGLLVLAVLSMLFFAFWLQKSGARGRRPDTGGAGAISGSSGFATGGETDAAALEALIRERTSAIGQLRPGATEFLPADGIPPRPISRDFHKLPDAYFLPQAPDATRRAVERIRELRETAPQSGAMHDAPTPGSGKTGGIR
ncbi:MAG TPA: hypothetical protein PLU72_00240 [Candidatus Ozemobacteraceae bacterium]|nr:hypothetical protein [Candidatus Ozemobacteraceae bacterium]HQG27758.1 hypothetical protein [Candidatus Ozemobacteraceae bacterium]